MKILHLNTFDNVGGASRAAYRLHQGMIELGVDSRILVQSKKSDDILVFGPETELQKAVSIIRPHVETLPFNLFPSKKTLFHLQWLPNHLHSKIEKLKPDIIHLHWICAGFIPVEEIKRLTTPIVWTLHDMWPLTGGCHLSGICERFKKNCGNCPQLGEKGERDLSYWTWRRKKKAWSGLNISFVSPSGWLADCSKNSGLLKDFNVEVIPNGLNIQRFKRIDQKAARAIINLQLNTKFILFGAMGATKDRNKGLHYLYDSIKMVSQSCPERVELIVFGESKSNFQMMDFGLKVHYLDRLYDDISLSLLYAASDVMVVPSIQESFGQTASEAMACGTPVVAFNVTGLRDIIDDGINGYLVHPFDAAEMANRICEILLQNKDKQELMRLKAREKVEEKFDIKKVALQYLELYRRILSRSA